MTASSSRPSRGSARASARRPRVARKLRLDVKPSPFLKWAGGKSQLLDAYEALLPPDLAGRGYHEPFVGGGALFFHLRGGARLTGQVHLSDSNADLMAAWSAVRDEPRDLFKRASRIFAQHGREQYYAERERFNTQILHPIENAALVVYLNKAGFNGLYRVNAEGRFNVPCGRSSAGPALPARDQLIACSEALRGVRLHVEDFRKVLERAERGDFVYFDPPYMPLTETASFTDYVKGGFGMKEQEELRDLFAALDARGCLVMLSNSGNPEVRRLYARWDVRPIQARRAINSKATARGPVTELVVRNF